MRKLSLLFLLVPFVTFSQVININQDNTNLKFANSINVEDLKTHLYTLAIDTNCFMSWRSFNESYFPTDWRYGKEVLSVNPISFNTKENWSNKEDHLGILFPNQNIRLKQSINVRNNSGVLWVSLPKNIFTKRYIDDSYHRADFNLYWLNIRRNLIERLSQFK